MELAPTLVKVVVLVTGVPLTATPPKLMGDGETVNVPAAASPVPETPKVTGPEDVETVSVAAARPTVVGEKVTGILIVSPEVNVAGKVGVVLPVVNTALLDDNDVTVRFVFAVSCKLFVAC
jgi:hypothetical protein